MLVFTTQTELTSDILSYYFPLIFSILSFLSCLLFLFTYIRHERLRVNSGKIILLLVIFQFFISSHLFASVLYDISNDTSISLFLSIIMNIFIFYFLMLNLFLCHNLLCCILYKETNFEKRYKIYLIISSFVSILITIIIASVGEFGVSPLGFCWLQSQNISDIIQIITTFSIFPFIIISMCYVYIKEHKLKAHSLYFYNEENFTINHRKMFVRINLSYVFVFVITWLPNSIMYVIHFILKQNENDLNSDWYEIIRAISLNFLCISAFAMFIVRIHEPIVRKALNKFFVFKNKKNNDIESSDSLEIKDEHKNLTQKLTEIEKKNENTKKNTIVNKVFPQQYDLLQYASEADSSNFTFLKKKPNFLKSSSKSYSEKDFMESKISIIKVLLGSVYIIRNDINSNELDIYKKSPPWDDNYYLDEHLLKTKIDDALRILVKNNENGQEKLIQILSDNLLEGISCNQIANLIFSHIKYLYEIDNIEFFDSLYPIENLKAIENLNYDPFKLNEDLSISSFICFNNKYYIKLLSLNKFSFFMDEFLKDLHSYIFKTKANTFLSPLIGLFNFDFSAERPIVSIFENTIGKLNKDSLYSLIIFEGLNVIEKKFKQGYLTHTEVFKNNDYSLENVLKLKYKDKTILLKQLKNDLKFLIKKNVTNYQIHLIFCKNKNNELNGFNYKRRKDYNVFETFIEGYYCKVSIVNYLCKFKADFNINALKSNDELQNTINLSVPNPTQQLKKINSGINENFALVNPENYAKTLMETIQELL